MDSNRFAIVVAFGFAMNWDRRDGEHDNLASNSDRFVSASIITFLNSQVVSCQEYLTALHLTA